MRWIDTIRQHLNVTALEARAVFVVSLAFTVGLIATRLDDSSDLHEHATAARIHRLLDSLQHADALAISNDQQVKPAAPSPPDSPQHARSASVAAAQHAINLNTATIDQLDALPGVGPATARAITEARARNRFTSVDDLLEVKGIGEKKLERIRPYVAVP